MAPSLIRACRSLALSTWLLSFCFVHLLCLDFTVAEKEEWYTAFVNITYLDPVTSEVRTEKTECGRYGEHSPKREARGVVLVPTLPQDRQACDPSVRFPAASPSTAWVALVAAGNCTYREKIHNVETHNASAVVIYNVGSSGANDTITMPHPGTGDVVAIMIPEHKGREILALLEQHIMVTLHITIGTRNLQKYVSRTSVVFVSISFIVLMIISLAWLIFYYIQRFRYANARDRNQRRLGDAAKKAISKLQVRTIKKGDKETESDFDNCAVCIEGYKPNDVVRILPCRHVFHKHCVDPWLQDHRTCPMCKMNILKALGIPLNADCSDDVPPDYEASVGGPPTNAISGASEITVNESSVVLDPTGRAIGLQQLHPDAEPEHEAGGESHIIASSEHQPPLSSDSDTSIIMGVEIGISEVDLSMEQECTMAKS
ncbi:RING finger protein 150a [Acanthopagrus latus]|uniref:RING finger protein 150a n=1 Tax=Acanthopagrus latus TaxID=8177 RepID=UPI00187BFFDA|nr:RING finger protein 150a [Acanthopagrus latus]XP_036958393.1 RING finger protein 150a [Acanthopagrus latus]XP_036958401.1 RING finger protein 150a [Acanthopagrus latus]XP_036958408.1 RING finger protein 150a [Acanthopagrus latus]XP_036958416.1 RING finger protein 150a [Acanthopagrus latus]